MFFAHALNLAVHIGAGSVAIMIGFGLVVRAKGTASHRSWGRLFFHLTMLVCLSAAIGLGVFRFLPVFALLTVLVAYQAIGGIRAAQRKAQGPDCGDMALTVIALLLATGLWWVMHVAAGGTGSVALSALGALAFVLGYDILRWTFPRSWHAVLWRYEHAYKMVSTLFGMVSAMVGNLVRVWQPWSQLLPSALGLLVIGMCFWRIFTQRRCARFPVNAHAQSGEVA